MLCTSQSSWLCLNSSYACVSNQTLFMVICLWTKLKFLLVATRNERKMKWNEIVKYKNYNLYKVEALDFVDEHHLEGCQGVFLYSSLCVGNYRFQEKLYCQLDQELPRKSLLIFLENRWASERRHNTALFVSKYLVNLIQGLQKRKCLCLNTEWQTLLLRSTNHNKISMLVSWTEEKYRNKN